MVDTYARMRQIIGTTAEWSVNDLVIGDGELAVERVTSGVSKIKIGDGVKTFSQLPYAEGQFNLTELDARYIQEAETFVTGGGAAANKWPRLNDQGKLDNTVLQVDAFDTRYVQEAETFQIGSPASANMWPRMSSDGKLDGSLLRTSLLSYKGQINSATASAPASPLNGDFWMQSHDAVVGPSWPGIAGQPIGKGDFISWSITAGWQIYDSGVDPEAYVKRDGDLMLGKLVFNDADISQASYRILPGVAPTSPLDGDVWVAGSGMFARIASITYKLNLGDGSGNIAAKTLVSQGGGSEGGQLILGYRNATAILGQDNGTWNVDVNSADFFRIFRQNYAGNIITPVIIREDDGAIGLGNYTPPAGTLSRFHMMGDASLYHNAGAYHMGFNTYRDSVWRAQAAGYTHILKSDFVDGSLSIYGSTASVAAGAETPLATIASFKHNQLWVGTFLNVNNDVKANTYYFQFNASSYIQAQTPSGNFVINFDTSDYLYFDRTTNTFSFNVGGAGAFFSNISETVAPNLLRAPKLYAYGGGVGGAKLEASGGSGNTGFVSFYDQNGTRKGYIGHINTAAGQDLNYANENGGAHYFNAAITSSTHYSAGGNAGYQFQSRNYGGNDWLIYSRDNWAVMHQVGVNDMTWWSQSALLPRGYHTYSLGDGNYPYWAAHAANWVTVSDVREKQWRGGLDVNELAVGAQIAREIGIYRLLREIGSERDKFHVGLRAQQIIGIMEANGLNPNHYGFIHHTVWEARVDHDIDGNEVPVEAGDRYGLDVSQLSLFLIACQEQRLAKLEALMSP